MYIYSILLLQLSINTFECYYIVYEVTCSWIVSLQFMI